MPARPDGVLPSSELAALSAAQALPAPTEAYWQAGDGARLRFAHWPARGPGRQGAVLYLNGRTEFIEKTIETYALLVRSGFDVWTLDWRGQGLSARALDDPHKGHIDDYQTYLDDLDGFVRAVTDLIGRKDKRLLIGHSMGGHIALRYLHDHPGRIDAALLSAPMIDISVNRGALRWLNRAIRVLGFGESYALGTGRFAHLYVNPADPADNGGIDDYRALIGRYEGFSSDARRRAEIERCVRANPALALGGPTSAWLQATFDSINLTWVPGYAEAIAPPVLMIGAGRDRTVTTAREAEMARRLPNGAFHLIEASGHEILVECDDVRREAFAVFAGFAGVEIRLPEIDMSGCARRDLARSRAVGHGDFTAQ